jgi:putative endonuclease
VAGALRGIGRRLRRWLAAPDLPSSPTSRLGQLGEREAARHLKEKGYSILERNYRIKQGEIDLVAFRDGVLAFVEVRAQTEPAMIAPLRTITRRKQRRIVKAAQSYIAVRGLDRRADAALRFDVVTVLFDEEGRAREVKHLEGAFHESPRGFT